ncbi:hypothetical protein Tco_1546210 [Tanacetum coccineum]
MTYRPLCLRALPSLWPFLFRGPSTSSKLGLRQDSKPKSHNLSAYKHGAGQIELVKQDMVKEELVNSHDLLRPGYLVLGITTILFSDHHRSLEFWCTAIAYDPTLPADDSVARPLKEYKIKFTVVNGKKPLTLDYKTFYESTGLDYNKGKYVSHPSLEAVKAELAKIVTNEIMLTNKSRQKYVSYPRFVSCALAELLGPEYTQDENFRSLPNILRKKKKRKSQTVSKPKPKTQGPEASGGNDQPTDKGLPSTIPDEGTGKIMPLSKGSREDKDSKRLKPLADMESQTLPITDLLGADVEDHMEETQSTGVEVSVPNQNKGKTSIKVKLDTQTLSHTTAADVQALFLFYDELIEESDDDVFEAGDEMDEDIQQADEEETKSLKLSKE